MTILAIALTLAMYFMIGAVLLRRGRWITAGIAMLGVSLIPALWEIVLIQTIETGANASLVFITVLLWPLAFLVLVVGAIRLMSHRVRG